jgi:hypothetical protein
MNIRIILFSIVFFHKFILVLNPCFLYCNPQNKQSNNKNSIVVELLGGLGNQLFIIASGLAYSLDTERDLICRKIDYTSCPYGPRPTYWDSVFRNIKPVNHNFIKIKKIDYNCPWEDKCPKCNNENPVDRRIYKNDASFKHKQNVVVDGLIFHYKNFNHRRDEIIKMVAIKELINTAKEKLLHVVGERNNKKLVSVHIRRGDLVTFNLLMLPLSYYKTAMSLFGSDVLFVVFSDDIEWCKENFENKNLRFVEKEKDYIELYMMSLCDHNIIANSTFSWWGAYLNQNKNKMVIIPENVAPRDYQDGMKIPGYISLPINGL